MTECLFCKIINKEIDSSIVYEDEDVLAINDINPQAPVHILLMPKKHIANLDDVQESDQGLLGYIQFRAREIARQVGVGGNFRLMTNCGWKAGQRVFHLHYHLMGGRDME
ncbi:MAG: histidine triad nucleotide-binding protein [Syntrophomonadaceae bacterium]|nr:histidine triad nucleotide-binding protein [Syntrophomonadaceae bacterium]